MTDKLIFFICYNLSKIYFLYFNKTKIKIKNYSIIFNLYKLDLSSFKIYYYINMNNLYNKDDI